MSEDKLIVHLDDSSGWTALKKSIRIPLLFNPLLTSFLLKKTNMMRKLLFPLFALLILMGCQKENATDLLLEQEVIVNENDSASSRGSNKINICHNGKIINININAIPAHQAHGDAVDMDGDGYFDIDNPCSETDCDDTTYDLDNSCCEEAFEIDFDGPLFVALTDEAGYYNWQEAIDACAAKAEAEGCGWYLPNKEELNALFLARNDIGGFDQSPAFSSSYWNSTSFDASKAWIRNFIFGRQNIVSKNNTFISCRCVRR